MNHIKFPRFTFFGARSRYHLPHALQTIGIKKPMIITDNFINNTVIKKLQNELNINYKTFSKCEPDPSSDSIIECVKSIHQERNIDGIIAVGGGSSIDTAKAASVISVYGGQMRDYKYPVQVDTPGLPIVAIPTTSGTGSEATNVTVITDSRSHEKMLCMGNAFLPFAAILDHELTYSMPRNLTAETGIDALCHAIEAYVSKKNNTYSDAMALSAIRIIGKNIEIACAFPNNSEARENMLTAANKAGIAFSNSSVTLIHALSRPLGSCWNISHGLSNAMLAPTVTKFSLLGAISRYATVARELDASTSLDDIEAANSLPEYLQTLISNLQIPTLRQYIASTSSISSFTNSFNYDLMSKMAIESGSHLNNPIVPTKKDIEELYIEAIQ